MTVYVDKLFKTSKSRKWRYPEASHLMADSIEELHAFADRLDLKRCWFQGDHYDITAGRRELAVLFGAVEVTGRELVALRRRLREEA